MLCHPVGRQWIALKPYQTYAPRLLPGKNALNNDRCCYALRIDEFERVVRAKN